MEIIQSPLNYTGGKYKLLKQILPLFPMQINTFVDLFCGGANVGVNVNAKKIVLNDIDKNLIFLLQTLNNLDEAVTFDFIWNIISKYGLSNSSKYGYDHYGCNSYEGLGKFNKERFLALRQDFNSTKVIDYKYYITLYVLVIFSFNNQIRYNRYGEFNLPVGKRDFNKKMQQKLSAFIQRLKSQNISFTKRNFSEMDKVINLNEGDFVYCDPPYLITCATYNENDGWNETREKELYQFLDKLNEQNIRFALSNVITSKGKTNHILLNWLNDRNYNCHHLNYTYSNSNYQIKNKSAVTDEVLITNY